MRRRHPLLHITLALATLAAGACAQLENLPRLSDEDLRHELAQSSMVFDRDGNLITSLHGPEDRTLINSLKRVPEDLQHAVISIEDERFYEHTGVDWKAIARAALTNAAAGEIKEGGSTITQQYVKNVIIAPGETAERTLERKINEAVLSRQLEKRWSKDEILLNYLNTVYFGQGAYGVQAAAKTYFGVPVWKLKLHESALLAGLIRAPSDYDPYFNREAAKGRRNIVLAKMAELEYITLDQASQAQAKGVNLQKVASQDRYPAPYFLDYVQRLIKYDERFEKVGKTPQQREQMMFQGGLRIHTTIDLDYQEAAEAAVAEVLYQESDPYASLVAIEPETGEVRAMVGGRDWFARPKDDPFAKLNLAILAEPGLGSAKDDRKAAGTGRQAGSAFKPFALAAAIENGISLSKVYKAPGCIDIPNADNGGPWHVCNYEGSDFGKALTLLEGTVSSVNTVYAQVIDELGPEVVEEVAAKMGINTPIGPFHSTVLGSSPVNPLGMTSAYATLANGGEHFPPVAITKITDATGKVLYVDKTKGEQALDPAVAYLTTSALTQVIQRGTGIRAGIARPAAGKTGTAQEYRDAWFAGYTPDLAAAVWVGYPEGEIEMKPDCSGSLLPCRATRTITSGGVTGGSFPAQIWATFMLRALTDVPANSFDYASLDLVTVTIDERCGLLANRFTPEEHRVQTQLPRSSAPKKSCRVEGDAVRVPEVFGFPVKDAVRILEDAGFEVEQVEEGSDTYPPGRVVGQDPPGGTKAPRGSTVVIQVSVKSDGEPEPDMAVVPDVLGMTRAQAEEALEDAGFEAEVIIQSESGDDGNRRRGRVWKQSPPGGTEAEEGSRVTIWVNPD
jgi:penicillin-binding protein 1A